MASTLGTVKQNPSGRYETFVEEQLARAQRRIRTLDLATSILGLMAGTLAYAVGMALLDNALGLSQGVLRSALIVYLLGALAYTALVIVRPLFWRINPYYAAKKVEETIPQAKNSVVNWLDLRDETLPAAIRTSLGHRAARDLSQADIDRAVSARRVGWMSGATLGLLLALLVLFFLFGPRKLFSLLDRSFTFGSAAIATQTQLQILEPVGGDTVVSSGQAVPIKVLVEGRVPEPNQPDALKLLFRHSEGDPYQERLLEKETHREWSATVSAYEVKTGFWYKVVGGDASTPEHRVEVRAAPLIDLDRFLVSYHPRAYLCRKVDRLQRGERKIEDMRGTTVTLEVPTNRKLKDARLQLTTVSGKRSSIPALVDAADPQTFRVSFVLEENGQYTLHFTSMEDESYSDLFPHPVVARVDRTPQVEIRKPAPETLPANGLMQLEGIAWDDVGVCSLTLNMHIVGGAELKSKPYRSEAELRLADGGYPVVLEYKDFVDLAKVRDASERPVELQVGMVLEYWLEARDNCDYPQPNVGQSKRHRVTIIDREMDPQKQQDDRTQAQKEQQEHQAQQDQKLQQESNERKQEQKRQEQEAQKQKDEQKKGQQGKEPKKPDQQQGQGGKENSPEPSKDKSESRDKNNKDKSEKDKHDSERKPEGNKDRDDKDKNNKDRSEKDRSNKDRGQEQPSNQPKDKGRNEKEPESGKTGQQGSDAGKSEQQKKEEQELRDKAERLKDALEKHRQEEANQERSKGKDDPARAAKSTGKDDGKNGSEQKDPAQLNQGGQQNGAERQPKAGQGKDQQGEKSQPDQAQGKEAGKPQEGKKQGEGKERGKDQGGQPQQPQGAEKSKPNDNQGNNGGQPEPKQAQGKEQGEKKEGAGQKQETARNERGAGKPQPRGEPGQKDPGQEKKESNGGQPGQQQPGQGKEQGKEPGRNQGDKSERTAQGKSEQAPQERGSSKETGKQETARGDTKPAPRENDPSRSGGQQRGQEKPTQGEKTQGQSSAKNDGKGGKQGEKTAGNGGQTPSGQKPGDEAADNSQGREGTKKEVEDLLRDLKSDDPKKREEAQRKLDQIAERARDQEARQKANDELAKMGKDPQQRQPGGAKQSPRPENAPQGQSPQQTGQEKPGAPKQGENTTRGKEGGQQQPGQQPSTAKKDSSGKQGNGENPPQNPSDPPPPNQGEKHNPGGQPRERGKGKGRWNDDRSERYAEGNRGGTDSPTEPTSPLTPEKPRFQDRAGVMQLENLKEQDRKKVLKDAGFKSEQEYRDFMKAYKEMGDREASRPPSPETTPRTPGSALPTTGVREVKGGTGKDDVRSGGVALPPLEYRDAYQEFTRKLAEQQKARERK